MKILPYKNLFVGITDTLNRIFFEGKYAEKEVERTLKSNKLWGSKDRAFIAETVYDLVRWRRMVEESMGKTLNGDNMWQFVGTWFTINEVDLPDWPEFKKVNKNEILKNHHKATQNPAVSASIPDWLNNLAISELGEEVWLKELELLNSPAPTVLRVNTLKTDRKTLQRSLKNRQINTQLLGKYQDALELEAKTNVFRTDEFQAGWFEVQDAGSQLIAPYLRVEPGMKVVDACAGAGGKTLHLAALMQNKGQIYALDIYEWKLKELKRRAKRNDVQNVQTRLIESGKTIKRLENFADRLLIDAPCSGLGVLRRNPDAKWKLSPEFIETIKQEQENILNEYCKMVKVGGLIVYATCSILPSENEKQVEKFLVKNTNYSLVTEKKLLPSVSGYDGFYMALIQRNA